MSIPDKFVLLRRTRALVLHARYNLLIAVYPGGRNKDWFERGHYIACVSAAWTTVYLSESGTGRTAICANGAFFPLEPHEVGPTRDWLRAHGATLIPAQECAA